MHFVFSHIDYCNSLLNGLPAYQLNRIQKILNGAARIIFKLPKRSHISSFLKSLHWLPVRERIEFKIILQVFKCLKGQAPMYLCKLINTKQSHYRLRSTKLHIPWIKHTTLGERAFAYKGPWLWNSLPQNLKDTDLSVSAFKSKLKTFLFTKAF